MDRSIYCSIEHSEFIDVKETNLIGLIAKIGVFK